MKILIYLFITLILSELSFAQNIDLGKISVSVVMPNQTEYLDVIQISKLETKITQIVANSGLTSSGFNTFIIYPVFTINDVSVVEGGMQNISIATCELNLFIKQIDNNIIFSSISKLLKGSGKDKKSAISNALQNIATNDPDFKNFIENGKQKIINYYESSCDDIIKKSESLLKMQKFDEAIGVLMSIPEVITACYKKSSAKAAEIYKAYQNSTCATQVQTAKTNIANKNYNQALNLLADIDPASNCFKEASNLAKTIESKIDAEDKKQWELKKEKYKDNVKLEQQRIDAAKEMAVAYYKSQQRTYNYNVIIK